MDAKNTRRQYREQRALERAEAHRWHIEYDVVTEGGGRDIGTTTARTEVEAKFKKWMIDKVFSYGGTINIIDTANPKKQQR